MQGKKLVQGDIISNEGMSNEVKKYREETGIHSMWTNSMFGGMPTYQILGKQNNNIARYINRVLSLGMSRPIGLFIYAMIAFYIMMLLLGVNSWLAIIGAVAFGLSTNNFVLYEAGHVTKLNTVFASPLIIAGVILSYRKDWIIGGAIFALGMALSLFANHIQMTYYLALSMIIYVLITLVSAIRSGEYKNFIVASGILSLGLVLAIGTGAANLLTTYEYSKDTMRGDPILKNNQAASNSSSSVKGLDWDYAMGWSNGFIDLFASYIPMAAGGKTGFELGKNSALGKKMRLRKSQPSPVYFGDLPSTSGPAYFGAVVFFLFVLGLFVVKGRLKWWVAMSCLLYFLLSMGRHFEFLNRLFFDFLPLFNKFRTPNSILTISAVFFPFFAYFTFDKILKFENKENLLKPLYITTGILSVVALYFAFGATATFDFQNPSDGAYAQRGFDMKAIVSDRQRLLRSSALRTLALVLVSAGLIYFWIKEKISKAICIGGIALLTLGDLVGVNSDYFTHDNFVTERTYKKNFTPRNVDQQILQDPDPHYRVYDLSIDLVNSASSSYFHKTIGGYHPAKLQRYQDMIDYHISRGNQPVLDMLNMKYIIAPQQSEGGGLVAQRNPAALGNAWFVPAVKFVKSANEEIESLNGFDPNLLAVVHDEFRDEVKESYTGQGSINLTDYKPNKLTYQSNSSSDQLALFSEVWYGPDKGWEVSIDGKKVAHIRANYILRALPIPSGNHQIVFEFNPSAQSRGELISLISSLLLLGGIIFGLYYKFKKT